jgi:hypothetical protein
MASAFEEKLDEWTQWYAYHRNNGGDVHNQIKFLKRSLDGALHLLHLASTEIRKAQGNPRSAQLWLPSNLNLSGSVKRFG